jgi:hypothetical protein
MLQTGLYIDTGGRFEVQGLLVTLYFSDMEGGFLLWSMCSHSVPINDRGSGFQSSSQ